MTALDVAKSDLEIEMRAVGTRARQAASLMALTDAARKTDALRRAAAAIHADKAAILDANKRDVADAGDLSAALRDRLLLDDKRVEAIAKGLEEVAALPDPVGAEIGRWTRPNGLDIARVRIPLGVVGIIYESRPNVTADAGGLCLRAGNAAILRGGSESFHSSRAIAASLRRGIRETGLPEDAVQLVPSRDREAVGHMLRMSDLIDIIVPRGGRGLIERVQREARMPVIAHLEGNCHVYIHAKADAAKARKIAMNAKMRRTGVCGAAETLLVDRAVATAQLPAILAELHKAGCEIRGDETVRALDPAAKPATEQDWFTEFLDAILAVRVVDGLDAAIAHVNHYGSHHTDAIVTEDAQAAEIFLNRVDSAIVLWNASTQFADGGEFGMGAEIGIGTGRLPPRGPVGAEQLTSYKYVVRGTGQVRP
ncbi:MAG TPA: glutamate-5-semialdehyde dehydrogenase [Stellaceae bacterium]|nr:glutamate-5-semialdehyde dehydrogenase [Stellaceae bacterium]